MTEPTHRPKCFSGVCLTRVSRFPCLVLLVENTRGGNPRHPQPSPACSRHIIRHHRISALIVPRRPGVAQEALQITPSVDPTKQADVMPLAPCPRASAVITRYQPLMIVDVLAARVSSMCIVPRVHGLRFSRLATLLGRHVYDSAPKPRGKPCHQCEQISRACWLLLVLACICRAPNRGHWLRRQIIASSM